MAGTGRDCRSNRGFDGDFLLYYNKVKLPLAVVFRQGLVNQFDLYGQSDTPPILFDSSEAWGWGLTAL